MNLINFPKDKNTIQEEAAEWIIRMDNADLTPKERNEFHAWLQESLRHKIEFIELAKVWNKMDALAQLAEETFTVPHQVTTSSPSSTTHKRTYWPYATAAAFILFCSTLALQMIQDHLPQQSLFTKSQDYSTEVGEVRKLSLADGSIMVMNTNSRIEINFSLHERAISLLQGEANFIVAKDPQRPFVVYVDKGTVTAIGTVFNVKYTDGIADVLVSEGKVSVSLLSGTESPTNTKESLPPKAAGILKMQPGVKALGAGQKISFNRQKISEVSQVETPIIERELSWQTGMLLFDNTPLEKVVREVSRYTHTRIVIQDAELFNLPVAGYFKAGETSAMLEVLQISFGIKVTHMDKNYIVLSKNDKFINH